MNKVGIFAGSFDPVHSGHIAFALQAIEKLALNEVYFLPEVKPRYKPDVSHISHRLAMLKLAIRPYQKLKVLELPDKQFSVRVTLPKITKQFKDQKLFLLAGTDQANHIKDWPDVRVLLGQMELIVASRAGSKMNAKALTGTRAHIIKSKEPRVSSSQIREAARKNKTAKGSLSVINDYIKANWLYRVIPE